MQNRAQGGAVRMEGYDGTGGEQRQGLCQLPHRHEGQCPFIVQASVLLILASPFFFVLSWSSSRRRKCANPVPHRFALCRRFRSLPNRSRRWYRLRAGETARARVVRGRALHQRPLWTPLCWVQPCPHLPLTFAFTHSPHNTHTHTHTTRP